MDLGNSFIRFTWAPDEDVDIAERDDLSLQELDGGALRTPVSGAWFEKTGSKIDIF